MSIEEHYREEAARRGLVGAFALAEPWRQSTSRSLQDTFAALRSFGVSDLFVEDEICEAALTDAAHAAGMKVHVVLCCYGKSKLAVEWFARTPALRPVDESGERWDLDRARPMVVPTSNDYNRALVAEAHRLAVAHDVDGLMLDFIRWPLHWEAAFRGKRAPKRTSFDEASIRLFSERTGIDASGRSTVEVAASILAERQMEWTDFQCAVISQVVADIRAVTKAARGDDFPLSVTRVPCLPEIVGQKTADLLSVADFVCPMLYHAVLRRPVEWVTETLLSEYRDAPDRVIPIVQPDTSEAAALGKDWGPPVSPEEWARLAHSLVGWATGPARLIAFPAGGLLSDGRGESLAAALGV